MYASHLSKITLNSQLGGFCEALISQSQSDEQANFKRMINGIIAGNSIKIINYSDHMKTLPAFNYFQKSNNSYTHSILKKSAYGGITNEVTAVMEYLDQSIYNEMINSISSTISLRKIKNK